MQINITISEQPNIVKLVYLVNDDIPELIISENLLEDDKVLNKIFAKITSRMPNEDRIKVG